MRVTCEGEVSLCIQSYIVHTGSGVIEPNPDFEIRKISEYADITNWCHHTPFLLPQGRTVWWNPVQKLDDAFEDKDEEDEDKEEVEELQPETGFPLLTSAAEDASRFMCDYGQYRWKIMI